MATERQSPDVLLSSSGVEASPNIADVQDDPDSPDANYINAIGNNTNGNIRVSFATPTGNPTVGADFQEFKVEVKQFDEGQTGDPDARIELWENGTLVRAGGETAIIGGSQVISFTWNANELGTADGSLVECKVVGTKSGGSPGARNTVDYGAVEWNVVYDSGVSRALVGTSDGVATALGVITPRRALVGSSAGVATAVGVITPRRALVGSSAGVATAGPAVLQRKVALNGSSAGVATAVGVLTVAGGTKALIGTSDGTSTAVGVITPRRALVGSSAGAATAGPALLQRALALNGSSAGVATAVGVITPRRALLGTSAGVGTASGALTRLVALNASAAGAATAVGVLSGGANPPDQERTLSALSVKILSTGEDDARKMTVVVSFTVGIETWEITIPEAMHDEIRRLADQFMVGIGTDEHVASLDESGNFTAELLK